MSYLQRFEWYLPTKPFRLTQAWGIYNPAYQEAGFGFTKHNGIDVGILIGTPIFAPQDGIVIKVATKENGKWQPKGGGVFVSILTKDLWKFDDGEISYVLIDFLHCSNIPVIEGQIVSTGELLAISGNTGYSTGPHTHMQFRRVEKDLRNIDKNEANNSFDPLPYCNQTYAGIWMIFRDLVAQFNKLFQ